MIKSERAKELLMVLTGKGLSIPQIAQLLGNSIDKRTLYRWLTGERSPQKVDDLNLLEELVNKL